MKSLLKSFAACAALVLAFGAEARTVSVARENKEDGKLVSLTVEYGAGAEGECLVAAVAGDDLGANLPDWAGHAEFSDCTALTADSGSFDWTVPNDWGTGSHCAVRFFVVTLSLDASMYSKRLLVAQWDGIERGDDPFKWKDLAGTNDIAISPADATVSDNCVSLKKDTVTKHKITYLECFKSIDPLTYEYFGFTTNWTSTASTQVIVNGTHRSSLYYRTNGDGYFGASYPQTKPMNGNCMFRGVSPTWPTSNYKTPHSYVVTTWFQGGSIWIDNTAYSLSGLNWADGASAPPDGTGVLGANQSVVSYHALRIYAGEMTADERAQNYAVDRARFLGDAAALFAPSALPVSWFTGGQISATGVSDAFGSDCVITIVTDTLDIGAPTPAYGSVPAGGLEYPVTFRAGDRFPMTNVLWECWGYSLGDAAGVSSVTNLGDTVTFESKPESSRLLTWLWRPCAYAVVAEPSGEGTETFSFGKGTYTVDGIEYYTPGAEVTVTPSDHNAETASEFIDWSVGAAPGSETANPLVFTMGGGIPRLTARFNRHWKYENNVLSDGNWHFTTSVRTDGGLKIVARTSGHDELLDFSGVEADTGMKVAEMGTRWGIPSPGFVTFVGPDVVVLGETSLNPATLKSVTLSPDLTTIGRTAFWQTSSLETFSPMVLPKLTSLGPYAFEMTPNLRAHFVMPALTEIPDGAFRSDNNHVAADGWLGIEATNVTTVGSQAFYMCRSLTNIVLSSRVTSIGDNAFNIQPKLVSFSPMRQPELTSLGTAALANEWALAGEWDFPALTQIPVNCFRSDSEGGSRGATARISVRATNVVDIGSSAFYWNWNVTNVVFSQHLTTIGESAFDCCCQLRSFTPFLPKGVTTIEARAFEWCSTLTIPLVLRTTTPVTVRQYAFDNAYNIPSFDFRAPIASIGDQGFNCLKPGATVRLRGAPPATLGSTWISTYNSGSPYAVLSVDAANYPAWLDLITYPVGSTTFESIYRNLSHYPGRQTLGVIKLGNAGAVWVVQSADAGTKLILR